ncbi:uncharacterized protein [Dermacentor andersoni]|uniref:uncharacterized protein n=1 Tax=Dermacentor andersoni TaxID=34620 RepID=UPI003B3BC13B
MSSLYHAAPLRIPNGASWTRTKYARKQSQKNICCRSCEQAGRGRNMPGNNHGRIFAVVLVGKLDEDEICLETITEEYLLSFLGMTTSALQEASVHGLGAMVARSTCLPRSPHPKRL